MSAKPNVIMILTDDQGYGDLSCHGNPWLRTPELDRLHGDGVRLTDFHVDPMCAPTRAALMTGRYSARAGVWSTLYGRYYMGLDETTIAEVFAASGYATGIFGKWHLGDTWPYRPCDRGFQETLTFGGGVVGEIPDYWDNDYFNATYLRNGVPKRFEDRYCTDVWFDEALAFIASWPAVIKERGEIVEQSGHIIDIMVTALDVAGGQYPKTPGAESLPPLPGRSLRPLFEDRTREPHPALFFQLFANRAVIASNWKLVSDWGQPWSLFNLVEDGAETQDLAASYPEKTKELEALWQKWWDAVPSKRFRSAGGEPKYLAPSRRLSAGGGEGGEGADDSAGTNEQNLPKKAGKAVRKKKAG